jgi:hypothetical protein
VLIRICASIGKIGKIKKTSSLPWKDGTAALVTLVPENTLTPTEIIYYLSYKRYPVFCFKMTPAAHIALFFHGHEFWLVHFTD